jgi:hypothetical protein
MSNLYGMVFLLMVLSLSTGSDFFQLSGQRIEVINVPFVVLLPLLV